MGNLKPIKPTLKEKKRYLVFEVISEGAYRQEDLIDSINNSILELIGTLGYGQSGVMVLKNLLTPGMGVLKCNNKSVEYVKASLSHIEKISNAKATVNVIGVSGILKKAKSKFMN